MLDKKDKSRESKNGSHEHHERHSSHNEWDKKSHHPDTITDYDEFAKELSPDDFE